MKHLSLPLTLALVACSSQHGTATVDAPASVDASPDATPDAALQAVTFSYTPEWPGVKSVDVIGGFGQSTDWTAPLVSLTAQGGTFTGTAMLPPGAYPYLFHVVGDSAAAAAKQTTFSRYAVDPAAPMVVACPSGAPSYIATVMNPCAQTSVPQSAPGTAYHVTGTVLVNGAPAQNYLVVLETYAMPLHHYFVNRVTTGVDGKYDLSAVAGTYRLQILHPQFESMNDAQLVPTSLNVLRRSISATFMLTADKAVASVDMAFTGYSTMSPTGSTNQTLPTTFAFSTTSSRLDVYGPGNEIGDPWYASAATTTGSASFTGMFNTMQAGATSYTPNTKYMWGIEQVHAATGTGGLMWIAQTMVFPITWN